MKYNNNLFYQNLKSLVIRFYIKHKNIKLSQLTQCKASHIQNKANRFFSEIKFLKEESIHKHSWITWEL